MQLTALARKAERNFKKGGEYVCRGSNYRGWTTDKDRKHEVKDLATTHHEAHEEHEEFYNTYLSSSTSRSTRHPQSNLISL